MRKLIRVVACAVAATVAACATGGSPDPGTPPQDAPSVSPGRDAHTQPAPDAPPAHDASVAGQDAAILPDAAVTPDAAAGSGGQICSDNTMCPDAGTCCFVAVCVAGQGVGSNLCFPS